VSWDFLSHDSFSSNSRCLKHRKGLGSLTPVLQNGWPRCFRDLTSPLPSVVMRIKPLAPPSGSDDYRSLVLDLTAQILFPVHLPGTQPCARILDPVALRPPCSRSDGWHDFVNRGVRDAATPKSLAAPNPELRNSEIRA
jgi:hypothetical protein